MFPQPSTSYENGCINKTKEKKNQETTSTNAEQAFDETQQTPFYVKEERKGGRETYRQTDRQTSAQMVASQ